MDINMSYIEATTGINWPVLITNVSSQDGTAEWRNETVERRHVHGDICSEGLGFFRWFFYTWVVGPMTVFGLFGNCIAFVVLFRKYRFRSNGILLIALTIFDTVVLCLQAITHVWQVLQMCHHILVDHALYFHFYRYCYPLSYITRLSIMGITMCLSWNRWVAICRPFTAKFRLTCFKSGMQILGVVVISVFFSLPRFYELQLVNSMVILTTLVKNSVYNMAYRTISFSLLMYVIPVGYVVYTCIDICRSFALARDYYSNLQYIGRDHSADILQATRITLAVCILALLCNGPALVSHVIWSLSHMTEGLAYLNAYLPYCVIVSNSLVAIGSATNIVVYCWCSQGFRAAFGKILEPLKKSTAPNNFTRQSTPLYQETQV